MPNYHATSEGNILFTPEEEIKWAEEQAVYAKEKPKILIKAEIAAIEATITPRRTREAILGTDNGWIANQEAVIALLRQQLAEL